MINLLFYLIFFSSCIASAQSSDTLIVRQMANRGISFSNNNRVKILMSGKEKFDDMLAAIKKAKESVHLEYFNFRNDSIANLLFDILEERAKHGVEIRALFDSFGNLSNNRPIKKNRIKQLRGKGVEIYEFDPIKFPWINHVFHRDHRKIVVVDGEIAYTGGMNVADYYIKGTKKVGIWRDMHCKIEGEEVNTLQGIFLRMWNKTTKQNIKGNKYFKGSYIKSEYLKCNTNNDSAYCNFNKSRNKPFANKMVGIINREPHTSNKIIREFYLNAINDAKTSIQLINPYLTLNKKLKKAIKNAIKRGVKVEIMVSTHSDIPLTPDCVFYNVHKLMKKGAIIWMYTPGFHHTKTMTIDGKFCTIGSANLNSRSLNFDYETNALIIDKETTETISKMFERDKLQSFRLTQDTWNSFRTRWQKFVGWFASLLSPVL